MRDTTLDHQIDVLSGAAEQRLQNEKFQIIRDRGRQKEAHQMRRNVLAKMATPVPGELPTVAALSAHERRNYSLQRLISNLVSNQDGGLEREISVSISQDLKSVPPHGGVWVPFRMSGLDTKTNAAGGYEVATTISRNIIDALRSHTSVLRLGATLITGLSYDFQLPVEDSILAANWVSENPGADVAESDPSLQARILKGHPMQATVSYSRQLLRQSTPDLEAWIATRIAKAHAQLLDKAAIHGSGTSNQPVGILAVSGIGSVAVGTDGGAVLATNLIALESAVADANGDVGSLGWLTNSKQRAKLRAVPEMAGGVLPIWRDGQVLSYPAVASNQVRSDLTKGASNNCSAIVFGDWSTLIVAEFGGAMELVYDEYAQKKRGMIELTSYASYDLGLTTPASMAAIQDAA